MILKGSTESGLGGNLQRMTSFCAQDSWGNSRVSARPARQMLCKSASVSDDLVIRVDLSFGGSSALKLGEKTDFRKNSLRILIMSTRQRPQNVAKIAKDRRRQRVS
jgi:hypothetical protein